MIELTIEELKDRIVRCLDATDFLEIVQLDIEDLVEAFTDRVEEYYDQLISELPIFGFGDEEEE